MEKVPRWYAKGDWFDVCKCNIPCPCTFAQPPTFGRCDGILAWHVRDGRFGNIWTGARPTLGIFIDSRGDEKQREALQTIFGGQAGGWPAQLHQNLAELRGIEVAPIEFEVAGDLAYWRAAVPGKVEARAEALTGPTTLPSEPRRRNSTGPTTLPGQRVQTHNPPGCETGPNGVATWGVSKADEVDVFGFKWSHVGQSSKHIPFDWTGPG